MFKRSLERKSTRLQGYDYSQNGYYFVTICVEDMETIFGRINDGNMILNKFGKIAQQCLNDLPNNYRNCFLDETIIMPNHVHCIIIIDNDIPVGDDFLSSPKYGSKNHKCANKIPFPGTIPTTHKRCYFNAIKKGDGRGFRFQGDGKKPSPTNANNTHGLCEMVRSFKHYVTRNINELNPNRNFKWHRSFNDRIIRNEKELYYIRQYICNNPKNW